MIVIKLNCEVMFFFTITFNDCFTINNTSTILGVNDSISYIKDNFILSDSVFLTLIIITQNCKITKLNGLRINNAHLHEMSSIVSDICVYALFNLSL